ncbi:MAG: hypothetical protein WAN48_04370 [Actinomycetes bacterium]
MSRRQVVLVGMVLAVAAACAGCTSASPTAGVSRSSSVSTSVPQSDYVRYEAAIKTFQDACTAKGEEAAQSPVRVGGDTYTTTTSFFNGRHPNVAICSYKRSDAPQVSRGICFEEHSDQSAGACLAMPSKYIRPAKPESGG